MYSNSNKKPIKENTRVFGELVLAILIAIHSWTSAKIMRVRITRPSRLQSNFRKVKRAIRGASFRSCTSSSSQPRFAPRSAAAAFRFPRGGHETRGQRRACLIARFLAFFSEARERAPRPWRMECGRGESRRVARAVCMVWHGMAWHGVVWHGMDIYAYSRGYDAPRT